VRSDLRPSHVPTAGGSAKPELLTVRKLHIAYRNGRRRVDAVRGVSFSVAAGEIVAVVGESGSGKSTVARALMGILPEAGEIMHGSILFEGTELLGLREQTWTQIRGRRIGWVPQDPIVALNALQPIGRQVVEPLRIHRLGKRNELQRRAAELLNRVGLSRPEQRLRQYPHELSGGMRQRVLIAGAIGPRPSLIIADEPTTALDVTVQKQILDDLQRLTRSDATSVLLITHDLAVAAERADRILVMRDGQIVEEGAASDVFTHPKTPYSQLLLDSAPSFSSGRRRFRVAEASGARTSAFASGKGRGASPEMLLTVEQVTKVFPGKSRHQPGFKAVNGVSLAIGVGETLALVGESGSGKSTLARMILGLTAPTSGAIRFTGVDVPAMTWPQRRMFRQRAQLIYQNPYASLNPRMSALEIVAEPLHGFEIGNRGQRDKRALELLEEVGIARDLAYRRPGELSGGQRQRVAIARALASEPDLIICDEPVSALDVSIQAQILALLSKMQELRQLSYLFISHDLAVVRQVADRVGVMRDGSLVELSDADAIFASPQHEYTRLLLNSIPGAQLGRAA
jgi:peptide/nickel transport system ATP-binding protein